MPLSARAALAALAVALAPGAALAGSPEGSFIFENRLRYETVDQDGFANEAEALTLRTRLGVEFPKLGEFQFLVEGENVTAFVEDYNSTVNGNVTYPVIADPANLEINRAQVTWTGLPDTEVVVGRQRIVLGDARFVGNVGFRQNEQTFDAARVTTKAFRPLTLSYVYVDRVHRVFGRDSVQGEWNSDSHLFFADAKTPAGQLSGYGFLLDFNNAPLQSSATWGARLTGAHPVGAEWQATYALEYARQTDYGSQPLTFDLDYVLAEAGARKGPFAAALTFERLGGDGARGFQTPLATLHVYQGWADVFLTTPAAGIRDLQAQASWTIANPGLVQGLKFTGVWHDFHDADGSLSYGREFDLAASATINPHWSAELKAASFDGDLPAFRDRSKLWLTLEYRF